MFIRIDFQFGDFTTSFTLYLMISLSVSSGIQIPQSGLKTLGPASNLNPLCNV